MGFSLGVAAAQFIEGRAPEERTAFAKVIALSEDFGGAQQTNESLNDVRTWWSFRENVAENPGLAMGFLDLFAGDDLNWDVPELFRPGQAKKLARQFYDAKHIKKCRKRLTSYRDVFM